MTEGLTSVSLCLLDDLTMSDRLKLGEFEVCYYQPSELEALLSGTEKEDHCPAGLVRFKRYAHFPWACLKETMPRNRVKTDWDRRLLQRKLSYHHAGVPSWYPFTELLRTLNLLKPTEGPVIARQFYSWIEPSRKEERYVDRVICAEPLWDYDGPDCESIHSLASAYKLEASDTEGFSKLRKQLVQCLQADSSHLRTAIHYFENGDRKIVPCPLSGSFNAIEPLMSYEAALEALLVAEDEQGVGNKLSKRVVALTEKRTETKRKTNEIENFTQRVFWLRSKIAHGARPIREIEDLIVCTPNDKIQDLARGKNIEAGDYKNLLIQDGHFFPGFLANLRELTRISIRFVCDELSEGRDKAETIRRLTNGA